MPGSPIFFIHREIQKFQNITGVIWCIPGQMRNPSGNPHYDAPWIYGPKFRGKCGIQIGINEELQCLDLKVRMIKGQDKTTGQYIPSTAGTVLDKTFGMLETCLREDGLCYIPDSNSSHDALLRVNMWEMFINWRADDKNREEIGWFLFDDFWKKIFRSVDKVSGYIG